jgi:endonuclease YncB( thermonuclease family)
MWPRAILLMIAGGAVCTLVHGTEKRPPHIVMTGKVVQVFDGDTLTLEEPKKKQLKLRLFGIDAPEIHQPFGKKAKEALADKVSGKTVRVEIMEMGRTGHAIGKVFFDRRHINMEMVKEGFAWDEVHFDKGREYVNAEIEAKSKGRGLWADAKAIPPWEFRRQNPDPE